MTTHELEAQAFGTSFWSRMRERRTELSKQASIAFRRNPLGALGLFLVVSIVLVAVFAPQIATHDPTQFNYRETLQPPSGKYLFGTDTFGRDIFSRLVYGSRISLRVAAVVMAIVVTIGAVIGATAGYSGGLVDDILMRITDIFLAFPSLVLAMAVNAGLGPGLGSAILAVSFSWWPFYARTIRSQVISTKNNLYVMAARSIGAGDWRVLVRHIAPNCIGPVIVLVTLDVGYVVLTIAGLSFIGLGAQPPTSEWGFMVSEGHEQVLTHWWWSTFPGLAMCLLVVGFNLLGDFLRDLLEPRLRGIGA